MILEKLDICTEKEHLNSYLTVYSKINSRWIRVLSNPKTIKFLKNIRKYPMEEAKILKSVKNSAYLKMRNLINLT